MYLGYEKYRWLSIELSKLAKTEDFLELKQLTEFQINNIRTGNSSSSSSSRSTKTVNIIEEVVFKQLMCLNPKKRSKQHVRDIMKTYFDRDIYSSVECDS